jgi:glycerol-3-phosphate O-acyltransferase 1/2
MGKPKKRETFFGACCAIWRVFTSEYGGVRLDFAQPFSLKEYMQTAARNSLDNRS